MNSSPLQALLFDFDGVLFDTEPVYWSVARRQARERGLAVPSQETLNRMMGIGRLHSMRILIEETGFKDVTPEQLLAEREVMMVELYSRGGLQPMPGTREILARFHGKLKLAIATNSPIKLVSILLKQLDLARFFEVVQTGDDIVHGKPDPEIYLKTIARLGVKADRSVVIEDTSPGCTSGHRAGAKVIAVPNELTMNQDFGVADARVHDLFEAAQLIETWL
jgi:HAD superfamily hydrolase (TIGR01509 family)